METSTRYFIRALYYYMMGNPIYHVNLSKAVIAGRNLIATRRQLRLWQEEQFVRFGQAQATANGSAPIH